MNSVDVQGLVKRYQSVEALRGVDLTVAEGRLFGLLGPNGAGKSTLIKALVGALRPSGGRVSTLGQDPLRQRSAVRQQIGYMPQVAALYDDLSARDNVTFFGSAHGVPDLPARVEEILALTDLTDRAGDPVRQFSGGMQRRVSLACALVHRPRILFLDEPTAAVDPTLRARFWATFRDLAASGVTLFISTHLMDEALLCDEVAILRQGRVIAQDTPQRLVARGRTRLTIRHAGQEETVTIGSQPEDLAAALRPYGLSPEISALVMEPDTLETVVLNLVTGEKE